MLHGYVLDSHFICIGYVASPSLTLCMCVGGGHRLDAKARMDEDMEVLQRLSMDPTRDLSLFRRDNGEVDDDNDDDEGKEAIRGETGAVMGACEGGVLTHSPFFVHAPPAPPAPSSSAVKDVMRGDGNAGNGLPSIAEADRESGGSQCEQASPRPSLVERNAPVAGTRGPFASPGGEGGVDDFAL